jgi:hypothetical protein
MRATALDSEQPKAQYKCPTYGQKFISQVDPDIQCPMNVVVDGRSSKQLVN